MNHIYPSSIFYIPLKNYPDMLICRFPFARCRSASTISTTHCLFLCLYIPNFLHWYIAVFKDSIFSYISYCARCHANLGHSWKRGHLSFLRMLKTAHRGQVDFKWPQINFLSRSFVSDNFVLTLRRLMSYIYIYIYIYGAPILDVSRSHTTTQHSR